MAKRSKRFSRHGRDQTGCMRGLISMFDIRHNRSPKRLLSDRSRASKPLDGCGDLTAETILSGPEEICKNVAVADNGKIPNVDVVRTSVKELMEEEMIDELDSKNKLTNAETSSDQVESEYRRYMKKKHKRKGRICDKSSNMDVSDSEIEKCSKPEEVSVFLDLMVSDNLDLETILEELAKINRKSKNGEYHDFQGVLGMQTGQVVNGVEESIISAIKLFLDQRVRSYDEIREEGKSCLSKELADAVKTLNSNKDVFFKLLKDPNSVLVKSIQKLDDARVEKDFNAGICNGSDLVQKNPGNVQSDGLTCRKHRNFFFRRKSKSLESNPSKADISHQGSSKIIILKPGSTVNSPETGVDIRRMSLQSYYNGNKAENDRNISQFSFHEIKRKLRHAMGKERQGISPDKLIAKLSSKHRNMNNRDRGITGENFPWSSPNRNHFYTERFTKSVASFKKGGEISNLKALGSGTMNEASQIPSSLVSNIYTEAKRHLFEILNNGDASAPAESQPFHKSLGRILNLPDYSSSPCYTSKSHHGDAIIPAYEKFSSSGMSMNNTSEILPENNSNDPSLSRQMSEIEKDDSGDNLSSLGTNSDVPSECSLDLPSIAGEITQCGVLSSPSRVVTSKEQIEPSRQEEGNASDISSESCSKLICADYQKENAQTQDDDENTACWRIEMDLPGDNQLFSPVISSSQSQTSREIDIFECAPDKTEKPSPVSVLEPFFMDDDDDDISPPLTKSQPGKIKVEAIQPLQFHFEEESSVIDHGICVRISLEDEESAFEYIEAVMLASDLNWDEFLRRWLSSQTILESSLFDDVQLFSSRQRQDQKLLFDCANIALEEICARCYGWPKHTTRQIPKGMDLIEQVWGLVERYLSENQTPCCLEQLIERDLSNSGKSQNLQTVVKQIGFETGDTIFDELMEDIVLSFVYETAFEHTCKV